MIRSPLSKVALFAGGFLSACALLLVAGTRLEPTARVLSARPLEAARPFPQDGKLRIIAFGAHHQELHPFAPDQPPV